MKLQEKILYCRKKSGLSQETLAEKIGVSRQAISKWETGDASPEIGKLLLLAKEFGVTTDWLLSEEDPKEEEAQIPDDTPAKETINPSTNTTTRVDSAPNVFGRLIRRYGWLSGVYLAIVGALFTGIGALAKYIVRKMVSTKVTIDSHNIFPEVTINSNKIDNPLKDIFPNITVNDPSIVENHPVYITGTVFIVFGIILIITGIILAIVLKMNSKNKCYE